MNKIKLLPTDLINKIAAGEVIQRPTNLVKELIENAIDAEAKHIKIFIENGGQKSVIVMDDGHGMSQEDLANAIKPHTTSKIAHNEDLLQINSLGFRGEALASMAQVSHLTIKTKLPKKTVGYQLSVKGDQPAKITPIGTNQGTIVIVDQLFFNTPARKKFQTQPATEAQHIIDLVTNFALAYPQLRFTLAHNRKTILDLTPESFAERVAAVLTKEHQAAMFELKLEEPYLKTHGFFGHPRLSRKTRSQQYIFINKRIISDPKINQLIQQAYHGLMPSDRFPSFVLSLEIPAELLDVNIHPQKTQIKMLRANETYELLSQKISQLIDDQDLSFLPEIDHHDNLEYKFEGNFGLELHDNAQITAQQLKQDLQADLLASDDLKILQLTDLYLILIHKNSLLIIDQHAAHEKILTEQLQTIFKQKIQQPSKLKNPITFTLDISSSNLLKDNLKIFKKLGITISNLKSNQFKINTLPAVLKKRDIKNIIIEVLDDLQSGEFSPIDSHSEKIIHFLACRAAIKAGDQLSLEQKQELVKKLLACDQPFTCPHGRPTIVRFTPHQLGKMFARD